jgi:hypothetical protein
MIATGGGPLERLSATPSVAVDEFSPRFVDRAAGR